MEEARFYQSKSNLSEQLELRSSSWDKSDHAQNSDMWLKYRKDTFLISTVEMVPSVSKFKECFGTFLKSTTKKETKILFWIN